MTVFGLLHNVPSTSTLLRCNRQFDMLEVMEAMPHLLGIGIDENTAVVVQGDEFELSGESYVVIYETGAQIDTGGDFYLLAPGDRFNTAMREARRPANTARPLNRVQRSPAVRRVDRTAGREAGIEFLGAGYGDDSRVGREMI